MRRRACDSGSQNEIRSGISSKGWTAGQAVNEMEKFDFRGLRLAT